MYQPKKKSADKLIYSGLIPCTIAIFTSFFYNKQTTAAISSETPYLVLTTQYNPHNDQRGLFLTNHGKGVAIIEEIIINDERKESISPADWINILIQKDIPYGCFDLDTPINTGMALSPNSSIPIISATFTYENLINKMIEVNRTAEQNINNIHRLDFFRETFDLLKNKKNHSQKYFNQKLEELINKEENNIKKSNEQFQEMEKQLNNCMSPSIIQKLEQNVKIKIQYSSTFNPDKINYAKQFYLYKKTMISN